MRCVINGSLTPAHAWDTPLGDIGLKCNHFDPQRRPSFLQLVEMLQADGIKVWVRAEDEKERVGPARSRAGRSRAQSHDGSAALAPAAPAATAAAAASKSQKLLGRLIRSRGDPKDGKKRTWLDGLPFA